MKAYVINLDSAEDRLAQLDEQALMLGFSYQRVSATDGRTPAFAEGLGARAAGPIMGRVIAPVEVACFESHRSVWRAIVDSGDSHGIALEDDVVFKPGFEKYLASDWAPPHADIVRLESGWKALHLDRSPERMAQGRALHRLRSGTFGAGAYAISATCAKNLLERTANPADPVDEVLFNINSPIFRELAIYQMTPAPVQHAQYIADYQNESFTRSALASARGGSEQQKHLATRKPWWRPFPDMPDPTLKDIRNMAIWTAKQRLKSLLKGTRFMRVPFG